MAETGFTGSRDYEPAGVVHGGKWCCECSCGGAAWINEDLTISAHSEPFEFEVEHVIRHWWSGETWRYELVE